jgi:hypothetical protein
MRIKQNNEQFQWELGVRWQKPDKAISGTASGCVKNRSQRRSMKLNCVNVKDYNRDSAVGIATGYALDSRGVGVRVPVVARFSSPRRPDRLWGPPSLLSNGYRRIFIRGKSGRGVKLTTHLELLPRSRRSRIHGSTYPPPHVFMVQCLIS